MHIENMSNDWDLVVVGGGITGAGVLWEATRLGLRALLVEQRDFAWGTSSRSAKLVHGGLRYLKDGRFWLTWESVKDRERLLKEAPGLVSPLKFLMPLYKGTGPGKMAMKAGLVVYDLMAGKRRHGFMPAEEIASRAPHIKRDGLRGGFHFMDAQVDDARLVLRIIREAVQAGASAMSYTAVVELRRDVRGRVIGVVLEDAEKRDTTEIGARAVINATGAWAERLHRSPEPGKHLRPLRGSHLVFPRSVFPVDHAIALIHPTDRRPVYALPWEGAVLFGTTDLDHEDDLSLEPCITVEETSYLMECLGAFFPSLRISPTDCVSTFAGIRPVLSEGKVDPSKESREHVVWVDNGMVTVTGGKLTTFYRLAADALAAAKAFLPGPASRPHTGPWFARPSELPAIGEALTERSKARVLGRYGMDAPELLSMASPEDLEPVPHTQTLWAELPFAARFEQVRHLSDLLLRRARIGLLTPRGGEDLMGRIRSLCEPWLPWDEDRWNQEIQTYLAHCKQAHRVPDGKEAANISTGEGAIIANESQNHDRRSAGH
jgi:glycerol-3-phosphate dehydrogenase